MATEAEFKIEELFFSITDKRGIILSGNKVFTRISEYGEEELFHKPHNLIRHPDMPKTVFKLLWDYLKANKDIAAYVKNRAKSGKYYWVLALVFPIEEGYLSIRLKPSCGILPVVEELYARCLEREKTHLDLDENLVWLQGELVKLGFSSYDEFMHTVLPQELFSRMEKLEKINVQVASKFDIHIYDDAKALLQIIESMLEKTEKLNDSFYEVNMITKNLLIATAHLGALARTISTVALNLQMLIKEVHTGSILFSKHTALFLQTLREILFNISKIHFIQEIAASGILSEDDSSVFTITVSKTDKILRQLSTFNFSSILDVLDKIANVNRDMQESLSDFVRIALGMNVICISGKIEIAHLSSMQATQELEEQLQGMRKQTEQIKEMLSVIEQDMEITSDVTDNFSKVMYHLRDQLS